MRRRIHTFESTRELDEAIKIELKRLIRDLPFSKFTRSDAIRSLIHRASTSVDKVEADAAT